MLTAPLLATILLVASPGATEPATTQTATRPAVSTDLRAEVDAAVARSLKRLATSQRPDGGWKGFGESSDPAISSLVAKCFVQDPAHGPRHPVVRQALQYILASKQSDGGIYGDATVKNYSTSVALMFLAAMNDPALEREITAQQQYLKQGQWIEDKTDNDDKTITTAHPWYGGVGYGQHKRPDLSNTQMMLEALHQSGLPSTDPVYQRALVFIARCQMCSETNDQPFAAKGRDGGFIYTPANGGESKAGFETFGDDQILRSYGSMTYAGFKSMLYAGVDRDDLRVQLAWKWIRSNYTLDANPNMPGKQSLEGLYYYYHVFAKALAAWGEPALVDITGTSHDWRADLCRKLLAEQKSDGSWLNTADRWMEGNPDLVSAYAILALREAVR